MLKIKKFIFSPFQVNTYILYDNHLNGIIIDPAFYDDTEKKLFMSFMNDHQITPDKIIATHGHVDHIFGARFLNQTYNKPLLIHPDDQFLINDVQAFAAMFSLNAEPPEKTAPISEKDTPELGDSPINIIHVPGHSPGNIALYIKGQNILFCGDLLFHRSIGRSDLPGGNQATLINSIKNKIFSLPDETIVYSGHGDETTVKEEKNLNPFTG